MLAYETNKTFVAAITTVLERCKVFWKWAFFVFAIFRLFHRLSYICRNKQNLWLLLGYADQPFFILRQMTNFEKGQKIDRFEVVDLIKKGNYAESYQVKDEQGNACFLKLMSLAKLQSYQLDDNGNNIEIEVCRGLDHPNLCSYVADGSLICKGQKYVYLVNRFENAATIGEYLQQNGAVPIEGAKLVAFNVLSALKYLHEQPVPVIHNEVTVQNVLLGSKGEVKLIDFGNSRFLSQGVARQSMDEQNVFYMAPERLNGVFSVQSDLYSVGVLLYHMVFNQLPYYFDISLFANSFGITALQQAREQPLKMPPISVEGVDEDFANLLRKALASDPEQRFQSAEDFIQALSGSADIQMEEHDGQVLEQGVASELIDDEPQGNGFADIAGMDDVKSVLQKKVINLLKDPEKAQKYKLPLPNGLLLYGPPGCGKTVWAQRLAEEAGFRYMYIKVSELLRIYMQGSHGVFTQLVEQAKQSAPLVICLDELELLLPAQEKQYEYVVEAGNEFLDNLEDCIEDGLFFVAVTSRPDLVDGSVVAHGRLENKVYIPMPDKASRKSMYEVQLADRPLADDIDYDRLADLSENFVINDIAFVVNDTALKASETDADISQALLEDTISRKKPSVTPELLKQYEELRDILEDTKTDVEKNRPHIGFR